jgi:flagellar biosynthetic protein FliS
MTAPTDVALQYSRMQLETATHPRLIWMLHAKCAQLLRQAALAGAAVERRMLVTRVQNLLAELEACLKITDEVSKGLFYLYDYCYCLLDTDNLENHALALRHLVRLSDTFWALLKKNR